MLLFLLCVCSIGATAQIRMQGMVSNKQGSLSGVLVEVENSEISTLTDHAGFYVLRIPERYGSHRVIFSFSGCVSDTLSIREGTLDVVLSDREVQKVSDIFVSTQKRMQGLVDVPISMTVLDASRRNSLGVDQIDEMSRYVPGFQNIIQAGNNAVYGIRGVASDGVESFFQSRISVYEDGVSITKMQASVIEPFDLERVEVVRGPQGTLFGRGSEVGAIHYIRNKPDSAFMANIRLGYGNYKQRTAEAVVNTPLGHKVANRFGVRYDAHDGYIKNAAGGTLNGKNVVAAQNATSWFINRKNTLTFTIDGLHQNDPGVSFKTNRVALPDGDGSTSPYTTAYLNGGNDLGLRRNVGKGILQYDSELKSGKLLSNTLSVSGFDSYEVFDVDGSYRDLMTGTSSANGIQISEELRVNWQRKNLSGFYGVSYAYENSSHDYIFNGNLKNLFPNVVGPTMRGQLDGVHAQVTEGVMAGIRGMAEQLLSVHPEMGGNFDQLLESFHEIIGQGMRTTLKATYDKMFSADRWETTPDLINGTAEAVYDNLTMAFSQLMDGNQQVSALLQAAMGDATVEQFVRSIPIAEMLSQEPMLVAISNVPLADYYTENMEDRCKTHEADLFAEVAWNFWRRFTLTAGLRATYELMSTSYKSSSESAPIVGSMIYHSTNGETVVVDTASQSWVGRLALNWKFDPTHNLYASVAKGRRPAVAYFDLDPSKVVHLTAERVIDYELGIKGISKKGYFSYNVAFFYYNWLHFQSNSIVTDEHGTRSYQNDDKGKARGYGLDGSLLYTFNDWLSLFIDYAWCHGRFCDKDMDGNDQVLSGNRFRLMPEHTFDMGLNINRKLGSNMSWYFHPSFSLSSKIYFGDNNSDDLRQNAFVVANANAGIRWKGNGGKMTYDLGICGKNITDSKYLLDAGNAGEVIGYPTFVAAAPATISAVLKVSFQ